MDSKSVLSSVDSGTRFRGHSSKSHTVWYDDLHRNSAFYLMLLPAVIAIILFSYCPLRGLIIAFLDYSPVRGFSGSTLVGLANFEAMFRNPFFADALRNTLLINGMKLLLGFPSAIILALLLNAAYRLGERLTLAPETSLQL